MTIIKSQPRDTATKGKALRREGIVPAVLYGKSLEGTRSIQLAESDVIHFLREHGIGAQVDIQLEDGTYSTILKDVSRDPVKYDVMHMDFQAITADEEVNTSVVIHFINRDLLPQGAASQEMIHELHYTAKPRDFVESIEIDLDGMNIGDEVTVGDLDIAKNPGVTIHTPLDSAVVIISHAALEAEEETEEGEEAAAEVPLVGEEAAEE